jgi:hypothetical protein
MERAVEKEVFGLIVTKDMLTQIGLLLARGEGPE